MQAKKDSVVVLAVQPRDDRPLVQGPIGGAPDLNTRALCGACGAVLLLGVFVETWGNAQIECPCGAVNGV